VKGGKSGRFGLVIASRLAGPTPKGVGLQFLRCGARFGARRAVQYETLRLTTMQMLSSGRVRCG
jgi:hypothetical protein